MARVDLKTSDEIPELRTMTVEPTAASLASLYGTVANPPILKVIVSQDG